MGDKFPLRALGRQVRGLRAKDQNRAVLEEKGAAGIAACAVGLSPVTGHAHAYGRPGLQIPDKDIDLSVSVARDQIVRG